MSFSHDEDHLNNLTPSHKAVLEQFRKEIETEGIIQEGDSLSSSDADLLRFLRARKFNLHHSKSMISNTQKWRKTCWDGKGLDELYSEIDPFDFPERHVLFTNWPMYFHKTDKFGRPINYEIMGGLNMAELRKSVSTTRHRQIMNVIGESLTREVLPACSRRMGKRVETAVVIADLEGFSLSQFWQFRELIREQFQVSQDHYPETMGKLVIINAPSSFTYIWAVAKHWLAQETIEKIDIVGHDYKEVLLSFIDEANLPVKYGGTCTCPGDGGCVMSAAGPWMDERMERRGSATSDSEHSARASGSNDSENSSNRPPSV